MSTLRAQFVSYMATTAVGLVPSLSRMGAGANPNRTTRIFVARIPPHVSDDQFRAYFAQFGAVQARPCPGGASIGGAVSSS